MIEITEQALYAMHRGAEMNVTVRIVIGGPTLLQPQGYVEIQAERPVGGGYVERLRRLTVLEVKMSTRQIDVLACAIDSVVSEVARFDGSPDVRVR
jgi:hypothetical protein